MAFVAVAERYRRQFGLDVEVLPAVTPLAAAFNAERKQHDANVMISGIYQSLKVPVEDDSRWIVGVTDADLYSPDRSRRREPSRTILR